MEKGKFFTKKQFVVAAMVLALGGAIWLNMQYSASSGGFLNSSSNSTKNLGDTKYVSADDAVETSAKVDTYIENAKKERTETREKATKLIEDTLKKTNLTEAEKNNAVKSLEQEAKNVLAESNIETTLKAKGFADVLALISENSVTVMVKTDDSLLSSQTLQIQDAVLAEKEIPLEKIKIVTVK